MHFLNCVYEHKQLGSVRLGSPDSSLLKRKWLCVRVGFLLMTSSHAQLMQIVITNSFLFIHHGCVSSKALGTVGGGAWRGLSAGITVYQIRNIEGAEAQNDHAVMKQARGTQNKQTRPDKNMFLCDNTIFSPRYYWTPSSDYLIHAGVNVLSKGCLLALSRLLNLVFAVMLVTLHLNFS